MLYSDQSGKSGSGFQMRARFYRSRDVAHAQCYMALNILADNSFMLIVKENSMASSPYNPNACAS